MGIAESKIRTLKDIITLEPNSSWAETAFGKFIDAKIGQEVSANLYFVGTSIGDMKENMCREVDKMIKSNEKLSDTISLKLIDVTIALGATADTLKNAVVDAKEASNIQSRQTNIMIRLTTWMVIAVICQAVAAMITKIGRAHV